MSVEKAMFFDELKHHTSLFVRLAQRSCPRSANCAHNPEPQAAHVGPLSFRWAAFDATVPQGKQPHGDACRFASLMLLSSIASS